MKTGRKFWRKLSPNRFVLFQTSHNILEHFQSGFRQKHSTETALLRITNDLLMSSDAEDCSLLVLLDLSGAFNTVDYSISVRRLRKLGGHLRQCLRLVLLLPIRQKFLCVDWLSCGAPQVWFLVRLCLLCTCFLQVTSLVNTKISHIIFYADDIQLYVSFKSDETDKLTTLLNCLTAIDDWLANNYLQLNADKTEVLIIAPDNITSKISHCIGSLSPATLFNLILVSSLISLCILSNISNPYPVLVYFI